MASTINATTTLLFCCWIVVAATAFLPKHHLYCHHSHPKQFKTVGRGQSCFLPVVQHDATLSEHTFQELYQDHLPQWLLEKCLECGFERPTLIQQRSLDAFFGIGEVKDDEEEHSNNHVSSDPPNSMVIQAQTGSGKSLCYLLPVLSQLEPRASVQAVIVVPTRELGLQVATVAKRLAGRKFMIMSLLQGSQLRRQRAWAWAETPQVVIGTPSELLDMVRYGGLPRISSVNMVIVDEVDACLMHHAGARLQGPSNRSGGGGGSNPSTDTSLSSSLHLLLSKYLSPTFADDDDNHVDDAYTDDETKILLQNDYATKSNGRKIRHRQTIFCSATIPQHRYFLKQCKANQWTLDEPLYVCTSPGEALPPTLQHGYLVCKSKNNKLATLKRVLKKIMSPNNKVLIFFDHHRSMEDYGMILAQDLGDIVFYVDGKMNLENMHHQSVVSVLRFEDSLSQRSGATKVFSEGENFRVLLTTDLAARGLDLMGITHVIHFDLAPDADTYLHRSGRTGRLGRKGQVLSILTPDQEFVLERLSNALQVEVKCVGRQKRFSLDNSNKGKG